MANSPTSIENQIDSFLEQFKRSASRAMEETAAHHQRSGSYNACSSSISRSRSGNLDLELLEAGNYCIELRFNMEIQFEGTKEEMTTKEEAVVADINKATEKLTELISEDNKEKMKASTQAAVADKKETTKESEVTDAEKKKNGEYKSVSTGKPKKTVTKIKTKKARNGRTSCDPTKLEDNLTQVLERFKEGCECNEDACFKGLNPEMVYRHRLNIAELTKAEHDMYLMGVTMTCLTDPYQTVRHTERRRLRVQYVYQGRRVCLDAFLYLENCTYYQLKRIRKHLMTHGVTPRVHGNHGKIPHNTFSLETYKIAMKFLKNFIEVQEKKQKTKLAKNAPWYLPPDMTRKTVYDLYTQYCKKVSPNIKKLGYSSFHRFMKVQFSQVKFNKLEFVRNQTVQNHCTTEIDDARDDTDYPRSLKPEITFEDGRNLPLVATSDLEETDTYVLTPIRKLHDNCTASYQVTTRELVVNCSHY